MDARTEASYEVFYAPYEKWYRGRIFPNESGITIFFADVTEEKKMQEQLALEQLLREKRIEALSHMAGGLAHEISNPLAIIHARASNLQSLIASGLPIPPEDLEKSCDSIVKTSDRAIRILKGLRGFGREAGNDPMEWASPYDIVEQCKELQEARFERHDVKLEFLLAPDLPLVLCRETQVSQIITNLVNNAFDAIEQSHSTARWVTIALEHLNEAISIRVTDSGPGIDEKFRPHLMDPFFTTKTCGLGMGVGLSLSRAIAHDHGGTLELLADTQNTCFQLILPINLDHKRTSDLHANPDVAMP
jgi:C4-dicarboxylate-specific signal transduction histidine kinase